VGGIDEHLAAHGVLSLARRGRTANRFSFPDRIGESLLSGLRERGMAMVRTADGGNPVSGSFRRLRGALIFDWVMPEIILGSDTPERFKTHTAASDLPVGNGLHPEYPSAPLRDRATRGIRTLPETKIDARSSRFRRFAGMTVG
jgi:hypothetical protein